MNSAQFLGSTLLTGDFKFLVAYLVGPLIGGAFVVCVYHWICCYKSVFRIYFD